VAPQVVAREAHQRSLKLSCFTRKILLQQYLPIGDIREEEAANGGGLIFRAQQR
jgi:hypothetical protein